MDMSNPLTVVGIVLTAFIVFGLGHRLEGPVLGFPPMSKPGCVGSVFHGSCMPGRDPGA